MIPAKNYFSGSLGKLQNIGGSRFFTTPHTIGIKPEYLINTQTQGSLLTCSLDGRLWLFSDYAVALKWNSSSLKMEFAKSVDVSNKNFIIRGIDWILTQNYFIQVLDDSPYLFIEDVNLDSSFTVDKFYSFLPAVGDWQIIKNFLVKRYANEKSNALYSLSIPDNLYLTHLEDTIWGKDSSKIGTVSLAENGEGYSLNISSEYSLNNASGMGLAFIDKDLYGFHLKQDNSLCPVSSDSLLYSPENNSWSNTFDGEETSGNIFFDPFYHAALAVRDNEVNLLPDKKIFSAKGIAQWFAPAKNIASVSSDFVIASLEHDIVTTHINSGLYRESLTQKKLPLTCRSYSDYKLSIGESGNALTFNKILCQRTPVGPVKPALEIKLLNKIFWPLSTNLDDDIVHYYGTYDDGYKYCIVRDNNPFVLYRVRSETLNSTYNEYPIESSYNWSRYKKERLGEIEKSKSTHEFFYLNLTTANLISFLNIETSVNVVVGYEEPDPQWWWYYPVVGGGMGPEPPFPAHYYQVREYYPKSIVNLYIESKSFIIRFQDYDIGTNTLSEQRETYTFLNINPDYEEVNNNILAFSLKAENRYSDFIIQDPVTKEYFSSDILNFTYKSCKIMSVFYDKNMVINNRALRQIYLIYNFEDLNIYIIQSEINPDLYPI